MTAAELSDQARDNHRFQGPSSTCTANPRLRGGVGPPVCGLPADDPIHWVRRWEDVAREWVLVLEWHGDGTATVRYPDGLELRVGQWILWTGEL